jgi:hypothetical protein
MANGKITMTSDGEELTFYIVEQTILGNINYLLVTDSEDEQAQAYIMKETGAETEDAFYEFVEDEVEFEAIAKVFEELLEDVDLEREKEKS